jgi:hypothetical protein
VVEVTGDPHASGLGARRHRSPLFYPAVPRPASTSGLTGMWVRPLKCPSADCPGTSVGPRPIDAKGSKASSGPPNPSIGGPLAAGSCRCPGTVNGSRADEPSP